MAEMALYGSLLINIITLLAVVYLVRSRSEEGGAGFENLSDSIEQSQTRAESVLKDEIGRFRAEMTASSRSGREEQRDSLKQFGDTMTASLHNIREAVEARLKSIQEDNNAKLERMRLTVDEKLHDTLEKKLGASFKQVSDQLEQVHKGVGEMRNIASSVGDLNRTLSNVKNRGTWGEMQLRSILEQILAPEQYAANTATKPNSQERVDFAIKLPDGPNDGPLLLPIDAKFPLEDYHRLLDAQEKGAKEVENEAIKALEARIKGEAKSIKEKYINPPYSTDFAILYLPSEGLYAEALRRPGLIELIQRDYRVTVAGPTTISALLNSLQMGFKTLAIQQRSSEVWSLLGVVKTEFGKFGDSIAATKKKLEEAANSIEKVETRARVLSGKLSKAESLPQVGEEEALE